MTEEIFWKWVMLGVAAFCIGFCIGVAHGLIVESRSGK